MRTSRRKRKKKNSTSSSSLFPCFRFFPSSFLTPATTAPSPEMASPAPAAKLRPEDVLGAAPEIAPDVWTVAVRKVFIYFYCRRRRKNGRNPLLSGPTRQPRCPSLESRPTLATKKKKFSSPPTHHHQRPPPASPTTPGSSTPARTPTTRLTRGWTSPLTARRCRWCPLLRQRRRRFLQTETTPPPPLL